MSETEIEALRKERDELRRALEWFFYSGHMPYGCCYPPELQKQLNEWRRRYAEETKSPLERMREAERKELAGRS